jgi:hypothetical protein
MKTRSDIVLVEVSDLDVLRHRLMPSKGFGFKIPKAIIELKFRRPNGNSDAQFVKAIEDDLGKLRDLHRVFSEDGAAGYPQLRMIVFDKKTRLGSLPPAPVGVALRYEFANRSEQHIGE